MELETTKTRIVPLPTGGYHVQVVARTAKGIEKVIDSFTTPDKAVIEVELDFSDATCDMMLPLPTFEYPHHN